MDALVSRTSSTESEVDSLLQQLDALQREHKDLGKQPPKDLEQLRKENTKLKYRLQILKTAVAKEESGSKPEKPAKPVKKAKKMDPARAKGRGTSVLHLLTGVFQNAIETAFPDLPDAPCPITLSAKQGDYQFNGAMAISGMLKAQGVKMNPRDVAVKVLEHVPQGSDAIDRTEVAGPGFVNIFLRVEFVSLELHRMLKEGVLPPVIPGGARRVLVDQSSPNIAKEMHVGHLRSTIIGDSMSNLLEFIGHDVLKINHVGDWGTQFGMLIAHLQDKFPNYLTESPPIADLMGFYKESKIRFDEDADFKKRAYESVVKLQAHEKDYIIAWKLICEVSRTEFQKIYDRLGVKNLIERGESFYQEHMKTVVKFLEAKNLLEEDEGRMIMFGPGCNIPLTVVKSDGGYTYDTSDMAAIKQRIDDEKVKWIVYTTDAGQATHFNAIFACARKAGILTDDIRVDHVTFGVVLGEDGKKFKTRSGDTVRLAELLDEGLKRAKDKLVEKERDKELSKEEFEAAMSAVAYGCIKYADLVHNRNHAYTFSFDKMLEDKGNTAVYMLYAYTRICSISRKAKLTPEAIAKARGTTPLALSHEKEIKLGKLLLRFSETILKIADDLFLHTLCEFMYEVATAFTEFYDVCYCVEKNKAGEIVKVDMGRILLCDLTAQVLAKCFKILGLTPVHRM